MKKILAIEDEPEMGRNITALLRYHEYEPVAAANCREGVESCAGTMKEIICLAFELCPHLVVATASQGFILSSYFDGSPVSQGR